MQIFTKAIGLTQQKALHKTWIPHAFLLGIRHPMFSMFQSFKFNPEQGLPEEFYYGVQSVFSKGEWVKQSGVRVVTGAGRTGG